MVQRQSVVLKSLEEGEKAKIRTWEKFSFLGTMGGKGKWWEVNNR